MKRKILNLFIAITFVLCLFFSVAFVVHLVATTINCQTFGKRVDIQGIHLICVYGD